MFDVFATVLLRLVYAVACFGANARQSRLNDFVFHALSATRMAGPLSCAEVALRLPLNLVQPVIDVVRRSAHACAQASHCLQASRVYAWAIPAHGLLYFIAQVQNAFPFGVRHEHAFKC